MNYLRFYSPVRNGLEDDEKIYAAECKKLYRRVLG